MTLYGYFLLLFSKRNTIRTDSFNKGHLQVFDGGIYLDCTELCFGMFLLSFKKVGGLLQASTIPT